MELPKITVAEYVAKLESNLEEAMGIVKRKCNDYAGPENPFKNFQAGEQFGMDTREGMKFRMLDKISRFFNLTKPGVVSQVKDESVRDTVIDLINYLNIWLVYEELCGKQIIAERPKEIGEVIRKAESQQPVSLKKYINQAEDKAARGKVFAAHQDDSMDSEDTIFVSASFHSSNLAKGSSSAQELEPTRQGGIESQAKEDQTHG